MNAATCLALLLAAPGPAGAEAPSSPAVPAIETTGSCPTAEAVSVTLLPLVASLAPSRLAEGGLRVVDLGERFEVAAAGQSRRYLDPARNCPERARAAAVFMALALNPPVAPVGAGAAAPPAVPPGSAGGDLAPATRGSSWWAGFAGAARFELAPAANDPSSPPVSPGGELRAAIGRGPFGGAVAGGILLPATVTIGAVSVRQQRVPFRVAATMRHKVTGRFELAGDVGLSFVVLRLRGEGLDTIDPATRLDVGSRAGIELGLLSPASGWAPFLELHLEYFPRPYLFEVGPLGRIGSTNSLWIGASAGISWRTSGGRYSAGD